MALDIPAPPRAETYSVAELVADALRGRLRIPPFQRAIRWTVADVTLLFDSLFRGYPVGSLLLWRGPPAPEGPAQLGPVLIDQPSRDDVRWIVDGQQRVVSLTAALTPLGAADPRFDLWFDPDGLRFARRPSRGPEPHWIEVWRLLDAADLGEFLLSWGAGTPERRRAVLEAGKRIREYRIPCTVMEATDERAVKLVFQRLNFQGKALRANEIFDGWAAPGSTLAELSAAAAQLGWGSIDQEVLLGAVLVNEGRDPTKRLTPEDEVDLLARAADRLRPGLLGAVELLRKDALIPHVRLLPYNLPLQVLPAFFSRHPDPSPRTRELLARWIWRVLASSRPADPTLLRAAARVVGIDLPEDDRVHALLVTAPPMEDLPWTFEAQRFRSDSGPGRIALVALASLAPLDLCTGAPVDVGALMESGTEVTSIVTDGRRQGTLRETVANRILHPVGTDVRAELLRWGREVGPDSEAIVSHAVTPTAVSLLVSGHEDQFLAHRGETIQEVVAFHLSRLTAWDQDDRPNLRELFAS